MRTIRKFLFIAPIYLAFTPITHTCFATAVLNIVPNSTTAIDLPFERESSLDYTVTNNTTKTINHIAINPSFNMTANLVDTEISNNTCNQTLASNSNCTFTVKITGKAESGSVTLSPRVCGFSGLVCSVPIASNRIPVNLTASVPTISGALTDVFCFNSSPATCLTVGRDNTNQVPMVFRSTNTGQSWSRITGGVLDSNIQLRSVTCTGSGSSTKCLSVGQDLTGTQSTPLILSSDNNGQSWEKVTNLPSGLTGRLSDVTCNPSACIAVGQTGTNHLLILRSTDNGVSWSQATTGVPTVNGELRGVTCSDGDASGVNSPSCVAVGTDRSTFEPLILRTDHSGQSWNRVNISIPPAGLLRDVFCRAGLTEVTCLAVGQSLSGSPAELLLRSTNAGQSWTRVTLPSINSGGLRGVACTKDSGTPFCTIVGFSDGSGLTKAPVLQSSDGGLTWTDVTNNVPTQASSLFGTTFVGSGSNATVLAVGQDETNAMPPLIIRSTDSGFNWVRVTEGLTS